MYRHQGATEFSFEELRAIKIRKRVEEERLAREKQDIAERQSELRRQQEAFREEQEQRMHEMREEFARQKEELLRLQTQVRSQSSVKPRDGPRSRSQIKIKDSDLGHDL